MSILSIPADSHFTLDNLPYGIFSTKQNTSHRIGVAIGSQILDCSVISKLQAFTDFLDEDIYLALEKATLNTFMGLTPKHWSKTRKALHQLLNNEAELKRLNNISKLLVDQNEAELHLPANIGDYTDFYSSKEHATNIGSMFRDPNNPLLPNWKYLPVAYHGRASSIVVSGTRIVRPNGQTQTPTGEVNFGPSKLLDFELELAFFVGGNSSLGKPISIDEASDHIFGVVLMNDWSARDIQKWEYVPLGPFNSKNFGTTISPWVVTMEALEPFKVANVPQDPKPFKYLCHDDDFNFDINLEVFIKPNQSKPTKVCTTNYRYIYWSMKQQLVHHTITGCNTNPGDLMGSGTISGPDPSSYGSLLELSWKGTKPLKLDDNQERKFLLDGDEVILTGVCRKEDISIGFGECRGIIDAPNAMD